MSSRYGPTSRRDEIYAGSSSNSTQNDRYGSTAGYGYRQNTYSHDSLNTPTPPPFVGGYRAATPNRKGQYSAAVMEELESQNDAAVEGLSAKVKMLKDITVAIGEEVRQSNSLIETMNEQFAETRQKLGGTMKNMLRMARRTGVGWKAWVAFFAAVGMLFWWVWI
ncbi:v-SNARE [Pyronema omphalodes]|nr:v-SNARE [Pyronema omphalodes]